MPPPPSPSPVTGNKRFLNNSITLSITYLLLEAKGQWYVCRGRGGEGRGTYKGCKQLVNPTLYNPVK